jgi:hypothetical protein
MNKHINNYNFFKPSSELKCKDLEHYFCVYSYQFNQNLSTYIHKFAPKIKTTPISTNLLIQFDDFSIQLGYHTGGWVNM